MGNAAVQNSLSHEAANEARGTKNDSAAKKSCATKGSKEGLKGTKAEKKSSATKATGSITFSAQPKGVSITAMQTAIDLAKQATLADSDERYEEALRLYSRAIDYFIHARKYECRGETSVASVQARCRAYLERVEQLKKFLAKKNNRGAMVSSSTQSTARKKNTSKLPEGIMMTEKPNVHWNDIAGLDIAKQALQEVIIIPMKFPHLFKGKRSQVTGILLYGPPGAGKSYLAKAVATEASYTFFSVFSTDINKTAEEGEHFIKSLFDEAKTTKPSIIFIDEIDVLCNDHSNSMDVNVCRIRNEFLTQMQGLEDGVIVMGATNIPWVLDSTFHRGFQKCIYIPLPEEAARRQMIECFISSVPPHCLSSHDLQSLAMKTDGYSGADIKEIVREALMMPIRKVQSATHFKIASGPSPTDPTVQSDDLLTPCGPRDLGATEMSWMDVPGDKLLEPKVTVRDFLKSLENTRPTVNADDLKRFEDYSKH